MDGIHVTIYSSTMDPSRGWKWDYGFWTVPIKMTPDGSCLRSRNRNWDHLLGSSLLGLWYTCVKILCIPVDRMSEIIPYIQRCQKYLLHCPAYSLRNDIHLWLLSGAHLWVSPPLTTHQSQFEIFIFHTFRLPPVSTKANHPSGQDSQLQHPSMYTSTEPFYKAYAILIHKAMVLTAIVPLPSHEPGQLLERLRCFKTQRRSLFQRRPFKKSPFQVAEKKKNATSSKQIQGTWCFGLNGHRRDPYVDDSVPEQCRLDVDLL